MKLNQLANFMNLFGRRILTTPLWHFRKNNFKRDIRHDITKNHDGYLGPHQGHGIHMESMKYDSLCFTQNAAIFHSTNNWVKNPGFHQPGEPAFFGSQASDASLRSSGTTATSPCWASTKGDQGGRWKIIRSFQALFDYQRVWLKMSD